jgi:ubiquinol-cytochrome c reductase cytochrome b subunit
MYCGAMPAEEPFITLSRVGTAYWFAFFLIIAPVVGLVEKPTPPPLAIHLRNKDPINGKK